MGPTYAPAPSKSTLKPQDLSIDERWTKNKRYSSKGKNTDHQPQNRGTLRQFQPVESWSKRQKVEVPLCQQPVRALPSSSHFHFHFHWWGNASYVCVCLKHSIIFSLLSESSRSGWWLSQPRKCGKWPINVCPELSLRQVRFFGLFSFSTCNRKDFPQHCHHGLLIVHRISLSVRCCCQHLIFVSQARRWYVRVVLHLEPQGMLWLISLRLLPARREQHLPLVVQLVLVLMGKSFFFWCWWRWYWFGFVATSCSSVLWTKLMVQHQRFVLTLKATKKGKVRPTSSSEQELSELAEAQLSGTFPNTQSTTTTGTTTPTIEDSLGALDTQRREAVKQVCRFIRELIRRHFCTPGMAT